jgi:hypothetical protein
MAKITLPNITAGYQSATQLTAGMDLIEAEFQNKVLYRDNTSSESNVMENVLDMNSNDINNVGALTTTTLIVGGVSLTAQVAAAAASAAAALISENAASASATTAEGYVDNFDDKYLGSKASDPTLDNDGDALTDGALYYNTTLNRMKVYDLGTTAWLFTTLTAAEVVKVTTVADNITNVNTVGGIDANVTTVAGIAANVTTVAGITANVSTVAGISGNVTSVAGISADVTAVAADATDIGVVSGISANVTSVAGISSNVTSVAGNSTNINAVAADSTDIGTVSTNIANVNTAAGNISPINYFATQYLGVASSAPVTTTVGALYYNNTGGSEQLYIWDGSAWQAAAFSTTGTVTSFNTRTGAVTLSSADVTGALSTGAIATAKIEDDAITADKMADDAVGISVLSATGTPGSGNFLRGDNTWTAVSTDPTMGGDLSGTASNAQIVASAVGATELNVTGDGTAGQALTSDADGTMTWATIEGASAGGAIYENLDSIAADFTLASNKNGMSVGPITINSGVTVTVPSGQNWVVL